MNNKELLNKLNERIYGHKQAKKVLINCINRSALRYYLKWGLMKETHELPIPQSCLLIGESGTGKTMIVEELCKLVNAPYIRLDATEFTVTSATGLNCTAVVKYIMNVSTALIEEQKDKYRTIPGTIDRMIIFVDEFDKLCASGPNGDWMKRTQTAFLSLFENKHGLLPDTDGITFIFAGAFSGLDYKKKQEKKSIGFFKNIEEKNSRDLAQEIIKYGFSPELIGRIGNIVLLDELDIKAYKFILINDIIVEQHAVADILETEKLQLSEEEIEEICNKAMKSKTGIRGMKQIINEMSVDLEFNSSNFLGVF
jgi:ATP-dependent protease Clp ATPase subunit